MLAKKLRTPQSVWHPALSLTTIASMLAPTGTWTVKSQTTKSPHKAGFLCGDLAFSVPGYRIWRSGRDSNPRPPA